MKDLIQGRELITLQVLGVSVKGTCHFPSGRAFSTQEVSEDRNSTGVLILGGLLSPRALIGDSGVYWAESFTQAGYPCFRVDLPGTCDSGGDAPAELMHFINTGNYEAAMVDVMKQIVARYHLSRLVIVAHCSGAVTAVFASSSYKVCQGLVLMEPYFHLPPPVATKTREALSDWASRNRLGGFLSNVFDRLKALRLRMRRSELPANANLPLIKRWKNVVSAGTPILVLKVPGPKASGAKPRLGEFDYMAHVMQLAGSRSRVDLKVVEGTSHSFADRVGRATVRRYTESWLSEHFPLGTAESALRESQGSPVEQKNPFKVDTPITAHASFGE